MASLINKFAMVLAMENSISCVWGMRKKMSSANNECIEGTPTLCQDGTTHCAGDSCCPGTDASDGQSYPCPSASSNFGSCQSSVKLKSHCYAEEATEVDLNAKEDEEEIVHDNYIDHHHARHGLALFNDRLDTKEFMGGNGGLFYRFASVDGDAIWSESIQGKGFLRANENTVYPLASVSKLYTGLAAMRTMELKPELFYPDKLINEFKGWEGFANFPIYHTNERANLTVHHLLTHTSGLPFGMRMSKTDVEGQTLFYVPGTKFGYTIGHRVIGWILRDFWQQQPETANRINSVNDCYRWLIWDKLGISERTNFANMGFFFGHSGEAGDASIQSTGADFEKLALLALRRGKLENGEQFISESNWNKWAVKNLLPDGKLSQDLVHWHGESEWKNFNVGGLKGSLMRQHGDYGWNYFGATYYGSKEIGWCGFYSSCLRISYRQNVAMVMMQKDIADLKKSKPYLWKHFDGMCTSMQCSKLSYGGGGSKHDVYCEVCPAGESCTIHTLEDMPDCQSEGKRVHFSNDLRVSDSQYTCYRPLRPPQPWCTKEFKYDSQLDNAKCENGACICNDGFCMDETRSQCAPQPSVGIPHCEVHESDGSICDPGSCVDSQGRCTALQE